MSKLVVLIVALSRVLDLARDRKDRTTKAYYDHETALMHDIKAAGIRNPLKVIPEGDLLRLICGQTRLNAARRAGMHEVPVTVLEGDLTPSRLLLEELSDNNSTQSFDMVALGGIFTDLMRENHWTTQAELCANVPLAKPPTVTKALKIFADLIDPLQVKHRAGEIGPRVAYQLARLAQDRQAAVFEHVRDMKVEAAEKYLVGTLGKQAVKQEKRCRVQDGPVKIDLPASSTWELIKTLGAKLTRAAAQGEKGPVPPALVLQNLLKS